MTLEGYEERLNNYELLCGEVDIVYDSRGVPEHVELLYDVLFTTHEVVDWILLTREREVAE